MENLRKRYSNLTIYRDPYLTRARDASRYTIPSLVPPAGSTGSTKLKITYSSFGARVVNSLSSKTAMALLPAGAPFFRYTVDSSVRGELVAQDPQVEGEIEKGLQKMESTVQEEVETAAMRAPVRTTTRHLIVAGNALVYLKPDNGLKVFALPNYVVKRGPDGKVLEIVVEEHISLVEVPAALKAQVETRIKSRSSRSSAENTIRLYTGIFRRDSGWQVWQELEDMVVPGSQGSYPMDACPWFALRWNAVDGEDYGRGHVEEYLGDLISIEGLQAAIVKAAAVAAKVVYLRNPTGVTKAKDVTRANSGDVVDGRKADIEALQADKQLDLQVARVTLDDLKRDVAFAFLMNQAVQRDAERVTAEEIRFMANELDTELGGIYTMLSVEFQLPLLRRLTKQLASQGKLPALPQKALKPMIVTGVEAIGRGAELDALRASVKDLVDLGGPEALQNEVNFGELSRRIFVARRVKTEGLVYTEEEKAANQQQKRMMQLVEQLGPNAINQAGALATKGLANQGTPNG